MLRKKRQARRNLAQPCNTTIENFPWFRWRQVAVLNCCSPRRYTCRYSRTSDQEAVLFTLSVHFGRREGDSESRHQGRERTSRERQQLDVQLSRPPDFLLPDVCIHEAIVSIAFVGCGPTLRLLRSSTQPFPLVTLPVHHTTV